MGKAMTKPRVPRTKKLTAEVPMRDHLIAVIQSRFRTFGGGKKPSGFNPLEEWLKNDAPTFAAGVDVGEVVDAILAEIES